MDASQYNQYHGSAPLAIEATELTKVYPPSLKAVNDVTFSVGEGEIFGLLGPNGAGKTTAIKMMTTMTAPTKGMLKVFGVDVTASPQLVRSMLGYVPQNVSVDVDLSAYENLLIFSKMFYVKRRDRKVRIREALEYMGLTSRANDRVRHFSGGMMRRLEIAQTLVNRPRILFLDEPSIGLDPNSRRSVWESILQLRRQYDMTIFITTHDMSEAERLCDRIAIMDTGKIAASGTPESLKKSVGGDIVTLVLKSSAENAVIPVELGEVTVRDGESLELVTNDGEGAVPKLVKLMEQQGFEIESAAIKTPGLDDAFVKYTKHRLTDDEVVEDSRSARRAFMRHAE
jgi:ABC-2 type transport system ATP-binding protein